MRESVGSILIGWREWASMPELNIPFIKVKVDTGAKTSALHAYNIEILHKNGKEYAKFIVHPLQRNDTIARYCEAEIVDKRNVKSSNGYSEERLVIRTPIKIGNNSWNIDITLTKRDIMKHRMLLGRTAMKNLIIDPSRTYCQGKIMRKIIRSAYSF